MRDYITGHFIVNLWLHFPPHITLFEKSSFLLSCVDVDFLYYNPCMSSWPGVLNSVLFKCCSERFQEYSSRRTFFESLQFFFHVFYPFGLLYVISFPLFYTKIVLLPLQPVVVLSTTILHLLVSRTFFRCFRMSCFVLYCLTLSWYLWSLLSFMYCFWFIILSCILDLSTVLLWFFRPNISSCVFLPLPFRLLSQFPCLSFLFNFPSRSLISV